jgi:sugar O-acyltransferase (sialic acid O-acetyltransferase NeuD family)
MKNLIIVGAGDFSLEIYSWLPNAIGYNKEWKFKGFLDDNLQALENTFCTEKILGKIEAYQPDAADVFVCGIAEANVKQKVEKTIGQKGGVFVNLIHSSVVMLGNIKLGAGVIIAPHCFISNSVVLGNHVVINVNTSIGHNVEIGDYTQVSGNTDITGYVKIGQSVFMSSSVTVIPKIVIEDNVRIGAGSVVIKHVKKNKTVFGNPAREIL